MPKILKSTFFERPIFSIYKVMTDRVGTQNWIFGYLEIAKKMGLLQVEQGFSSFFAKFWHT